MNLNGAWREKPKLDKMTHNTVAQPGSPSPPWGFIVSKSFFKAPRNTRLRHLLTRDMINSVQASYLSNHQQISQSTSGLNAASRAVLDGSHLLGSLLNFIRQDLNTDEAATQHTIYRVFTSSCHQEWACYILV